jgi:hypothetical protein
MIEIIEVLALQEYTTSGRSAEITLRDISVGNFFVDVTVDNGTTLDLKVQISPETSPTETDWYDVPGGAFPQITATGKLEVIPFTNLGNKITIKYTIVGTSFTFGVKVKSSFG